MVLSSIGKIFSKKSTQSNLSDDVNTIDLATQRQLIWRRFKRHRLGFSASIVVILFYVVVLMADFLSTAPPVDYAAARGYTVSYTHLTLPTTPYV